MWYDSFICDTMQVQSVVRGREEVKEEKDRELRARAERSKEWVGVGKSERGEGGGRGERDGSVGLNRLSGDW